MNILLKNVLDACVGAIGFYLFGYVCTAHTEGKPSGISLIRLH